MRGLHPDLQLPRRRRDHIGGRSERHGGGGKNITLLRLGECPAPVALAIGTGGEGPYAGGSGGSGYVAYSVDLPAGAYVKMMAFAGRRFAGSESYVKDMDTGSIIVQGDMGGEGERTSTGVTAADGGAGYSGGGGYCFDGITNGGGSGGRNGGDGGGTDRCKTSAAGGEGSDLNITSIPLRSFKLSPGDGGSFAGLPGGGGGGGILVDNNGPARPDYQTGEGFGGGGFQQDGLPGVVLLDFVPEE